MDINPAFHPHILEHNPDMAPDALRGTRVPANEVKPGLVPVTCSPDFDPNERRAYGGVMASVLAGVATYFVALRRERGLGPYIHRLARLTKKVSNALYIYSRVKEAMAFIEAPEEIEIEVTRNGYYVEHLNAGRRPITDMRPAPPKQTQWATFKKERGYDVRETSLKWVEARARVVKARARKAARKAYIEAQRLEMAPRKTVRVSTAQQGSSVVDEDTAPMILGEIWPPVPVPRTSNANIKIKRVDLPRPDAFIESEGRKLGLDVLYYEYNAYAWNYTGMWNGEVTIWQRGPP